MESSCSACNGRLEQAWKFCPRCGYSATTQPNPAREDETPEAAPTEGAFSGLLFGLIAMPVLLIVGIMLCLTGLGAILGVPMIVAGILAPLAVPMFGLGALKGECPWCGIAVSSVANSKDFNCHGCGKRISIKHRQFIHAIS